METNRNNRKKNTITFFWCFYFNIENISELFLVFLLLTLNKKMLAGYAILNLPAQLQSEKGEMYHKCIYKIPRQTL